MKFYGILFIMIIASFSLIAQVAIAPVTGDGTEQNPYEIATLQNLYWIAASDDVIPNPEQAVRWSSHYVQIANIDASDTENWFDGQGWMPIGEYLGYNNPDNLPFSGYYDGQNNEIVNLYIVRPETFGVGLWGYIVDSTIKRVGVSDAEVKGSMGSAGLVGIMIDSSIYSCYMVGSVWSEIYTIGGLVGYQQESSITDSYSRGVVIGRGPVGGLVGEQYHNSTITNSFSTANVNGTDYVGGLVGYQMYSSISNSYSIGDVSGRDYCVGGLVGWQILSTISDSYSTGRVKGRSNIGGLVGEHSGSEINNSFSTGNVSGYSYVGGLTGSQFDSSIENSFCTGNVSGYRCVGGLVGDQAHSSIINCYSIGSVIGKSYVGGLVGRQFSDSSVTNSYWNIEMSGHAENTLGERRTTVEMTYPYAANTYVDWDFVEIWTADVDYTINQGYPFLQGMPVSIEEDFVTLLELPTLTNFANPFNPETTISFTLPQETEQLELKIYNIRGQLVRTLIAGTPHSKGEYRIVWDGRNDFGKSAASGVYFYRVTTPSFNQINKMLLLK
jgi:hypothetical protein